MTDISIILGLVAFCSGVLKSGFAVGAGIFMTPVLAFVTGPKEAVALVAPIMLFTDMTALFQYWRKWSLKDVVALVVPCFLGAVAGVLLLDWFSPGTIRRAIGIIGLAFVITELFRVVFFKAAVTEKKTWSSVIGFAGGAASALANAGGVFLSPYLAGRLTRQNFVGTLIAVFLGLNITKVSMMTWLGLLNGDLWLKELSLIPLMVLGGFIGKWLNSRVDEKYFKRWIFAMIALACGRLIFF
jgi:uncharacterized membrane protein YfcA